MTFSRLICAAALGLLSTPALAVCPTGADLSTGIVFVDTEGNIETFTAAANDTVQQDGLTPDGFNYRTILGKGVHVIQLSDTENGVPLPDSIINTSYPMNVTDLPIPTANSQWSVKTIVNAYGDIYEELQAQRWGAEITYTVGTCTFRGIPGKIRYDSDGSRIDEEVMFLPDLGMSLLLSYANDGGPKDTYTFAEARTVQ